MRQETPRAEMTRKPVLYQMPGMDAATVRRDVEYRPDDANALAMDLYYPPDANRAGPLPAVIFVSGYSDLGLQAMLGCKLKDWESYISWGRLAAASGLVGVTYSARQPAADLAALLQYLRQNAEALGIDATRIGVWACSGNSPMALSALIEDAGLRCGVLCYGYTLDLDGATGVAEVANTYGFANPCAGKTAADLPRQTPLLLVRAGQDQLPHINQAMDRFAGHALAANLPLTVVNHATGPHAFDLLDDSRTTREIIRQVLAFLQFHLAA